MRSITIAILTLLIFGFGCQTAVQEPLSNQSNEQQTEQPVSDVLEQPAFFSTDYVLASAHDVEILDLDLDADGVFEKAVIYKVDEVPYGLNGHTTNIEYLQVYRWEDELEWSLIKEDQRAEDTGGGQLGEFCQVEVINFEPVSSKDFLLVSKCHAWGGNEGYYLFGELPDKPGVFDDLAIPKAYLNEDKYLTEEGDKFLGLEKVDVIEFVGLVERYGVACESRPDTYGHFGGDEAGYCRRLGVLQQFDGQEFTPTIYNGTSSVSEVWSLYINKDAGFQIQYPSGWKTSEYFSEGGIFSAVAFDPAIVVTSEEYHTLDLAPGTVWVFLEEVLTDTDMEIVEISSGVMAKTFTSKCEDGCPNPWWLNKIDRRYYVNGITIGFAYLDDLENDVVFQQQLNNILSSFRLVPGN